MPAEQTEISNLVVKSAAINLQLNAQITLKGSSKSSRNFTMHALYQPPHRVHKFRDFCCQIKSISRTLASLLTPERIY